MVLSNAERQKRYRQRLKAAARGGDLPERVRTAVDQALDAVWTIAKREGDGSFDEFPSLGALKADMASGRDPAGEALKILAAWAGSENGKPDELAAIERAIGIVEAVLLRHDRAPKKAKKRED